MAKDNISNLVSALLAFISDDRKNTKNNPSVELEIQQISNKTRRLVIYVVCILGLAYSANLVGVDKLVVYWINTREQEVTEMYNREDWVHVSKLNDLTQPLLLRAQDAEAEVVNLQAELRKRQDDYRRLSLEQERLTQTIEILRERLRLPSTSRPNSKPPDSSLYDRLFDSKDP